jgi:pyrimidine-nucleoside phosphorylase
MQTKADARKLAHAMVVLGNECGVNTRAMLTDMNTPLGRTAGNWLEVKESVACLEAQPGRADRLVSHDARQRVPTDLRSLVLDCAAHLLMQTKKSKSLAAARKRAEDCLNSGGPRRKWDEMLVAQDANLAAFNKKLALDHTAPAVLELKSPRAGFVSKCDARIIGEVIRDLGGGRLTKESVINYDVGVDRIAKPGEAVQKNSVLTRIHAAGQSQAKIACTRMKTAFEISAKPVKTSPLILEIIQ